MPWSIFALLLLAALMHALWNALVKGGQGSGRDSLATMTLLCAVASLVSLLALLSILPLPARASWALLALSLLAHLGYKVCLLLAYRYGELGQVYPIARGLAPILLLLITLLPLPLLSFVPAGMSLAELSVLQSVAVLLIALSVISLAFIGREKKQVKNKLVGNKLVGRGLIFACATACFIAIYSMLDAMGARLSQNPIAYVATLMALDFLPIALVFLYCDHRLKSRGLKSPGLKSRGKSGGVKSSWQRLTHKWQLGVAGGLLSLGAYAIVVYAMAEVAVAPVVAMRETSIVFAALLGWLFLRERGAATRLLPAILIAIAVAMLKI